MLPNNASYLKPFASGYFLDGFPVRLELLYFLSVNGRG